jgi:acyl-coenzyme A synthetase/AMP-(fatty) acid ligase
MWLWESISGRADAGAAAQLHAGGASIRLAELMRCSALGGQLEALRDRVVLVATHQQLTAALALIELDGVARRVVLCPPDLDRAYLPQVIRAAGADACVGDAAQSARGELGLPINVTVQAALQRSEVARRCTSQTEWILLTSGTSGAPKLVLHTLASLSNAFSHQPVPAETVVWSTFYDIRRYGGLQILLRALHDGALVLSSAGESVPDFLARAAAAAVTHISGTASHWRGVLMSGAAGHISPRYVRLSGEIADQGILDALQATYPAARVAHAYASTEAGVAFEIGDGAAGFPTRLIGVSEAGVELRIAGDVDGDGDAAGETASGVSVSVSGHTAAGTLQVRSPGTALRYLGSDAPALRRADGFVDNGDQVELRGGRYYFVGRRGGVINVGGLKVHPEEVEAVINSHPWVRMARVRGRRSPITGAVVTAEVVLLPEASGGGARPDEGAVTAQILEACRRALAAHKVPAMIRVVPSLPVSAAGKLVRADA